MKRIINNLKCGYINKHSENAIELKIASFSDIYNIIIPLFKEYKIQGIKALDFVDFCQVAELINKGTHLTLEGLEQIKKIKSQMNKGRLFNK
jgi:hypothetical protein